MSGGSGVVLAIINYNTDVSQFLFDRAILLCSMLPSR